MVTGSGDQPPSRSHHGGGGRPHRPPASGRGVRVFGVACVVVGTLAFVAGVFGAWVTSQLFTRGGTPIPASTVILGWLLPALVQLMLVVAGVMLLRRR